MSSTKFSLAFTYSVQVTAPPYFLGVFPEGLRLFFHSPTGTFNGHGDLASIRGRSLPQAGDVFLIQPNDIGVFDVLATLEMDDGQIVAERHKGRAFLPPGAYARMLEGKPPVGTAAVHAAFEFVTAAEQYSNMSRDVFFADGLLSFEDMTVRYEIFRIE